MSSQQKYVFNTENNKVNNYNDIKLFLNRKYISNNNKSKILSIKNSSIDNKLLKVKLNYPKLDLNKNYFNKNNINKLNNNFNANTPRDYHKNNIENYNIKMSPSISSNIKISNKKIKDILSLNNSNNEKPKVILPKIKVRNQKKLQSKEKSAVFGRNIKKIYLGALGGGLEEENNDYIKKNKNSRAKSEWNLLYNDDYINFGNLILNNNYRQLSDINNNNNSHEKSYKNGAERLKEIHRQKLVNCHKLIKQTEKEVADKKKIINKYIELMRQDFENTSDFNVKFS